MSSFTMIIVIIIIIIIIIGIMMYAGGGSAKPVVPGVQKTLKYNDKVLVKSSKILKTSNYIDKILYLTLSGLVEYDINTGESKVLNPIITVKGLAYDKSSELYLVLSNTGKLYNLDHDGILTPYGNDLLTYSKLYDTEKGYYIQTTDNYFTFIGGSSIRNKNLYGDIQLTII